MGELLYCDKYFATSNEPIFTCRNCNKGGLSPEDLDPKANFAGIAMTRIRNIAQNAADLLISCTYPVMAFVMNVMRLITKENSGIVKFAERRLPL